MDMEKVVSQAIDKVEQSGIIFLDEIDKIAGKSSGHGPDVSCEGVHSEEHVLRSCLYNNASQALDPPVTFPLLEHSRNSESHRISISA